MKNDVRVSVILPDYLDKRLKEVAFYLNTRDNEVIIRSLEWYLYSTEIEEAIQEIQENEY